MASEIIMKSNYCFHLLGALMSMIVTISSGDNPRVYDYFAIQYPCENNRLITPGQGVYSRYGFIRADSDNCIDSYKDCSIYLNASSGHQITMRIQYMATDCSDGALVLEGATDTTSYCGFYTPSYSIYSSTNWLKYRFYTTDVTYCQSGFSFYYTTYHTGECSDDEFRCANGRCIPEELKCDIYDHCGDWSDERSGTCGLTDGAIAAISVTCVLVGLSCIVFLAYCLYDKKHRRQNISTTRRGSTDRCEVASATTVPVGPLTYADSPPNYTYVNSIYSGVYEDPNSDPYRAPPSYQTITINNSYPN